MQSYTGTRRLLADPFRDFPSPLFHKTTVTRHVAFDRVAVPRKAPTAFRGVHNTLALIAAVANTSGRVLRAPARPSPESNPSARETGGIMTLGNP